jgi:ankyrin repeat protein
MVKVLLEHGASTLTNSAIGFNALQEAIAYGSRELIQMMLKARHQELISSIRSKKETLTRVMVRMD